MKDEEPLTLGEPDKLTPDMLHAVVRHPDAEPDLMDLRGIAPDLTGGMPSEEWVRMRREYLDLKRRADALAESVKDFCGTATMEINEPGEYKQCLVESYGHMRSALAAYEGCA